MKLILLSTEAAGSMSLWDMVVMGGWLMVPIFAASIIAIYIFCERFWLLRQVGTGDAELVKRVSEQLRAGKEGEALATCEGDSSPLARVLAKGIRTREEDAAEIRRAMEETANHEVAGLERGLPTLATCAGIAPMIGFLGTVVGMVQSFYDMSTAGSSIDIGLLSRGIYTAMITTVAGLIVGIIGQLAYNFLVARVDGIVERMVYEASELIEVLHSRK